MKALETIPVVPGPTEPWPQNPRVEVRPARSNEVLVAVGEGRDRYWALDPYSGCAFACVWCRARNQAPFRDADPRVFERDIHARVNAAEAVTRGLKEGAFARTPLVLGTRCDPWQPAEQRMQLTRGVLEVLARQGGVDLRAQTRSSFVPRDADLLASIARKGRVSVTFSLPTQDQKLSRVLEPLAPSPDRRLVALEALARAGIRVGVNVAPVLLGVNDQPAQIEALLRRARDAGASYVLSTPLSMPASARERMVRFVDRFDRQLAVRYERLLSKDGSQDPGFLPRLEAAVGHACRKLGLAHHRPRLDAVPGPQHEPQQLSLF